MGTLNPQRLTHCTVIVAHCLSDAPAKDSSSGFLLGRVSKVRHGLNGILLVPSAVADSRISRRIFVRRKNSAEIAAKNMFNRISTWQLQICFRIMIDVILTFDILINRLTQETQLMLTNHAPLLEVSQGHKHDTPRFMLSTVSYYSAIVTLSEIFDLISKPGFGVTQSHRKRHVSIRHIWFPINVL